MLVKLATSNIVHFFICPYCRERVEITHRTLVKSGVPICKCYGIKMDFVETKVRQVSFGQPFPLEEHWQTHIKNLNARMDKIKTTCGENVVFRINAEWTCKECEKEQRRQSARQRTRTIPTGVIPCRYCGERLVLEDVRMEAFEVERKSKDR